MESQRQVKYGRQIQKDLAAIFQKDPSYFFKTSLGTITEISISPDLAIAKVYISVFPIANAAAVFEHLNAIKSEIKNKLGRKIGNRVRIIPELVFLHDDTEEKAAMIDKLIDELDIPPPENE